MKKYKDIATSVILHVGGKENIITAFHCATRLRFDVKDKGLVNLEELKLIKGVMGTQIVSEEIQVIIGPDVDDVYNEVIKLTDLEGSDQINENLDGKIVKQDISIKGIFNGIINAFSACMNPLVPVFILLGTANVIATLIGPMFMNIVTVESDLYKNFYYIGQAIIYFLPILTAVTASRKFKANIYISLVIAFILLYPDLVALMSKGEAFTVYGIPAASVTYSGSLIPIILIVCAQAYIEKFINKVIPNAMKVVLVPLCTVLVLLPLALCVLGPLGNNVGVAIASGIIWLRDVAGPLETMLVGAFVPFMTAFGIGRPVFFISLTTLIATGSEFAYMPFAMVLTNWVSMGVAVGYTIKAKKVEEKQLGLTCLAANFLSGVSEPTLFGVLIPNKKTYVPTIVGGALSGLYIGVMNVGIYQFGASNFLNVMGFVGGSSNNFLHGCIASGIAFFTTFIMMLIVYREKDK